MTLSAQQLTYKSVHGNELAPYVQAINELCSSHYAEYPYFAKPDQEAKKVYLKFIEIYAQSSNSIAILAFDNNTLVGTAVGLPINEMRSHHQKPFDAFNEEERKKFFVLGEMPFDPAHTNKGYEEELYARWEQAVKAAGFNKICLCELEEDNIQRPADSFSHEAFWRAHGFTQRQDLAFTTRWATIHEPEATEKRLVYWIKELK